MLDDDAHEDVGAPADDAHGEVDASAGENLRREPIQMPAARSRALTRAIMADSARPLVRGILFLRAQPCMTMRASKERAMARIMNSIRDKAMES